MSAKFIRIKKGCNKAQITKMKKFVDSDSNEASATESLISTKLHILNEQWSEFKLAQDKLFELLPEEDIANEEEDYERTQEQYEYVLSKLNDWNHKLLEARTIATPNTSSNSTGPVSTGARSDIRLPKLDFKEFSGDYREWVSFVDLFKSIVDSNTNLSNVVKLQYLKSKLAGEARQLLDSVQVTDSNYAEAWKILQERYDNRKAIISEHFRSLFSLGKVRGESAVDLRKLLDVTVKELRSLTVLGYKTDEWDSIITFMTVQKLDDKSLELWNMTSASREFPKFKDLKEFIDKRCCDLEGRLIQQASTSQGNRGIISMPRNVTFIDNKDQRNGCVLCKNNHPLFRCSTFIGMTVNERISCLKRNRLCYVCFKCVHPNNQCPSQFKCKTCGENHNTLIHKDTNTESRNVQGSRERRNFHVGDSDCKKSFVLLSTAIIRVRDADNKFINCRILLDNASQSTFISEECVSRLGLKRNHANGGHTGLGSAKLPSIKGEVKLEIKSMFNNYKMDAVALVVNKVTGDQPSERLVVGQWRHLKDLPLADPNYNHPGRVDILLGADYFARVLIQGLRKGGTGEPVAQNTEFGWVLFGNAPRTTAIQEKVSLHTCCDLDEDMKKFLGVEEVPEGKAPLLTEEESKCEEHFANTYSRDEEGRFIVRLPFKQDPKVIGHSRAIAYRRLQQVERKLQRNPECAKEYSKFIHEYIGMKHMGVSKQTLPCIFLPHHYVEKLSSLTTKLRVVFDGSAKTDSGYSLNDCLMTGTKLQDDLFEILVRFRSYQIGITADIEKMFRQIKVHPDDYRYQCILWRNSPCDRVQEYQLQTVTYGQASATYLATKCLQQLALDGKEKYPLGSQVVMKELYVDDLATGADELDEGKKVITEATNLLNSGKFPLRKFMCSDPRLFQFIPQELRATGNANFFDSSESMMTLGVGWDFKADKFYFAVKDLPNRTKYTKRNITSDVAKTFDPLGWLSPFTVTAKILLQKIWVSKIGWDQEVTNEHVKEWLDYKNQLGKITRITINRKILIKNWVSQELHGFCDASSKAYSACVYMVSTDSAGNKMSALIAAKTRVAPVTKRSIPKLELSGAALLVKLMKIVVESMNTERRTCNPTLVFWTDSTTVIYWLMSDKKWKIFVLNRKVEIKKVYPDCKWYHVVSKDNPADCASRGIIVDELINHPIWWTGPKWLVSKEGYPKNMELIPTTLELAKESKTTFLVVEEDELLLKYSDLNKLIVVTRYILRFINICKSKIFRTEYNATTLEEKSGALEFWVKKVQNQYFASDIQRLQKQKALKPPLDQLMPFLDNNGLLRVGGRIQNASGLQAMVKHPLILPKQSNLSKLIVRDTHIRTLHSGQTLLLATLRQKFWIISARRLATNCIKRCIDCVRYKMSTLSPLMSNLPSSRVNPSPAFTHTGTDFAGPFQVKKWHGRGNKSVKSYICIFVCFSTKAVHLEFVSELSTSAFIAALIRFTSLRGKPTHLYSDNGTNYVGADRELREFCHTLKAMSQIDDFLAGEGIAWSFIPPSTPHQGGIWEAVVKSTKHHLRRELGANSFTIEEFITIISKIGSCLNSRPLCELSNDPGDLEPLTPGHFLIMRPMNGIPEPDITQLNYNTLDRWQKVTQMYQLWWKRWTDEYCTTLQKRAKWTKDGDKLIIGDIVIIKEENLPPGKWKLGRVTELIESHDSIIRSVKLRTKNGELIRPLIQICPLPRHEDNSERVNDLEQE